MKKGEELPTVQFTGSSGGARTKLVFSAPAACSRVDSLVERGNDGVRPRPLIFISYSRQNRRWMKLLRQQFAVAEKQGLVEVFSDDDLEGGVKWHDAIQSAIHRASVAILLVSPEFLTSDYCVHNEASPLLERCDRGELRILPVLVEPVLWNLVPWLSGLQVVKFRGKALSELPRNETKSNLSILAWSVLEYLQVIPPDDDPDRPGTGPALSAGVRSGGTTAVLDGRRRFERPRGVKGFSLWLGVLAASELGWVGRFLKLAASTLHFLIHERVRQAPGATAVEFEDSRLTHGELDALANRLARHLRRLAVGPEVLVGLAMERDTAAIAAESAEPVANGSTPESLAYVIYTSGSTGKPKGVQILHAARLLLASRETTQPGELKEILEPRSVTAMQAAHATWWSLLLGAGWAGIHNLKILWRGKALLRDLAIRGSRRNVYDPTEATIWSTLDQDLPAGACAIERPLDDIYAYLLDDIYAYLYVHMLPRQLNPVPVGVLGELLFGRAGLFRDHRERPDLTAEEFVLYLFACLRGEPVARLYRTGDSARHLLDSNIEFPGRIAGASSLEETTALTMVERIGMFEWRPEEPAADGRLDVLVWSSHYARWLAAALQDDVCTNIIDGCRMDFWFEKLNPRDAVAEALILAHCRNDAGIREWDDRMAAGTIRVVQIGEPISFDGTAAGQGTRGHLTAWWTASTLDFGSILFDLISRAIVVGRPLLEHAEADRLFKENILAVRVPFLRFRDGAHNGPVRGRFQYTANGIDVLSAGLRRTAKSFNLVEFPPDLSIDGEVVPECVLWGSLPRDGSEWHKT